MAAMSFDETMDERIRRETDLAFEQGVRKANVDHRLDSHEARLNAINGSIERHANNAAALRDSIEELGDKLDGVITTLNTQAAVEQDRVRQIKTANEKQISSRQFWFGVAAIIATLVAALLASAHVFGGIMPFSAGIF